MEYTEGTLKDAPATPSQQFTHPYEYEQASNSYLMAVVAVIAGMPLPIINLIAAAGYYLAQRKSSYFVRWHCIQSALGQMFLIPFNSTALAWTLGIFISGRTFAITDIEDGTITSSAFEGLSHTNVYYWLYISFIILLNLSEFIVVISTATRVRKGHNVRWWGIAKIADRLCSKEDRNPYKL